MTKSNYLAAGLLLDVSFCRMRDGVRVQRVNSDSALRRTTCGILFHTDGAAECTCTDVSCNPRNDLRSRVGLLRTAT